MVEYEPDSVCGCNAGLHKSLSRGLLRSLVKKPAPDMTSELGVQHEREINGRKGVNLTRRVVYCFQFDVTVC